MGYTIRELQLSILELMKEFKKICDENNLSYILVGGTCLGAIRHNGFIPWDDDADVAMPREDYEKFKIICNNSNILNSLYVLQDYNPKVEPHYADGWIRIRKKNTLCVIEYHKKGGYKELGVFLDIFPYDYVYAKNEKDIKRLQNRYSLINRSFKNKITIKLNTFKSKILRLLILFTPTSYLYNKRETIAKKFDVKNANHIVDFNSKYGYKKATFNTDIFSLRIEHTFEGVSFYIPKNYDEYLKVTFNDYMKLPPIEEQVGHLPKEIKL